MKSDPVKRAEEMIQKLRKLKGFCPMTPEEADAACDAAAGEPMSDEEIQFLVDLVTSGKRPVLETSPVPGWVEGVDISEIEDEALQLHRNKGDDDGDSTEEDSLRQELLSDEEESEDEDGLGDGEEPPAEGR